MDGFSWKPSEILKAYRPVFRILSDAVEAGAYFGTEAAKFQKETGIAGQRGAYGGGAYSPKIIEQEWKMFGPGVI